MTHASSINYELAAQKVDDGSWRVDPEAGKVYGVKGAEFVRTNTWGYVQIKFRDPDNWRAERAALAHRVIWESVHGPLDVALTINHINGDKRDNRLSNLEAVTQGDNVRHAFATGLNNYKQQQTHCARGHEFSASNTRLNSRGDRICRACDAYRARQRRAQRITPHA